MVIGSLLEKGFGASLSSSTDIVGVWNKNFLLFYKFFFGKVKTIFWESESKCSKLFKSKFGNRKFYRKLLWSDLEIKIECPEHMKMSIFSFVQFLSDKNETIFWGSEAKHQKLFKQNLVMGTFLQDAFEASLNWRINIVDVWKKICFSFLQFFDWRSWKTISEEMRQNVQNYLNQNLVTGSFLEISFCNLLGHSSLLVKDFSSFLELKNKYCWCFKVTCFLQVFDWRSWNHLPKKWRKFFKTI